jgi:hypothetical protein
MVTVKRRYRYVYEDVSRHGQVRLYFWRGKGYGKMRMRATLGAKAFEDLYDSLLNQVEAGALTRAPRDTPRRGVRFQSQSRYLGLSHVATQYPQFPGDTVWLFPTVRAVTKIAWGQDTIRL